MYYKFSGFTQRLVGVPASVAYTPQGLKPAVHTELPPLTFETKTASVESQPSPKVWIKNTVPELQKLFQKPDGVPVYLKRGLPDQLLYRTTMALTIGGTIYCLIALFMPRQAKK
uniref:Cytochrome c oxidase subunit 7A2-like, mitochondrial n=1 Tax=Sphenodon punctatus TaxID=8508 RepID=A0A8D0LBL0_SPHPU